MRIVVALGGNALLQRGEAPEEAVQRRHVRQAAQALAPLAAEHQLVVCHGNGPQIGVLALESVQDRSLSHPYPLDALGAATQGMIGYWLAQELAAAGVAAPVLAVVTQTVVDAADPGFGEPTKFIGPGYDETHADRLTRTQGWRLGRDGTHWRRVVPSPRPVRVVEEPTIRSLVDGGALVVCGGGGGVPVVADDQGRLTGVDAVVDKDLTAALLAVALDADRLLLLTDVPAVMRDFGTPHAGELRRLTTAELAGLALPAGSMRPKVEACGWFAQATGRPAAIGALGDAAAVLGGRAGTSVVPADAPLGAVRSPGGGPAR
ncbi:carbamate kinase [Modestobacter sp. SSW1-42]|uniref:carbamate kinase n=1 Tax=Modestobacter sp. SSW1-42 TaxID=596372 RepID=UPI003986815E